MPETSRNFMATRPFDEAVVLVMNKRTARLVQEAIKAHHAANAEPNGYDQNLLWHVNRELCNLLEEPNEQHR
jgi:hypothetical protein